MDYYVFKISIVSLLKKKIGGLTLELGAKKISMALTVQHQTDLIHSRGLPHHDQPGVLRVADQKLILNDKGERGPPFVGQIRARLLFKVSRQEWGQKPIEIMLVNFTRSYGEYASDHHLQAPVDLTDAETLQNASNVLEMFSEFCKNYGVNVRTLTFRNQASLVYQIALRTANLPLMLSAAVEEEIAREEVL